MTIFREEVGGWFLVMFVSLLFGKVWGWISEGRVDFLEQQPPSNPRLFHARLSTSLLLSVTFTLSMLNYCLETVYIEARPGMMVMFAFEFAVLFISSVSTSIRYGVSLMETYIVRKQTQEKLRQRRAEILAANEASQRSDTAETGTAEEGTQPPQRPEDITEDDVEAPGWEDKGRWIFYLDVATDFCKLVVYIAFFVILMFFHGLPIHIMRDVYMTARSFTKRIADFVKYRQATKDMNEKYPDATSEELGRESTCIICREDMRLPQADDNPAGAAPGQAAGAPQPPRPTDERLRPKKLPCGHILHLACLRSWLERQQVCPICRRSVLVTTQIPQNGTTGNANQQQGQHPNPDQNQRQQIQNRIRRINLGPFNLQFGVFQDDQWQNMLRMLDPRQQPQQQPQQQQQQQQHGPAQVPSGMQRNANSLVRSSSASIQNQLRGIEQQVMQEIRSLGLVQQQLSNVLALQGELARLRIANSRLQSGAAGSSVDQTVLHQAHQFPQASFNPGFNPASAWTAGQQQQRTAMGAGHPDLPSGLVLPQGWTALPLQRLGAPQPVVGNHTPALQSSSAIPGPMAGPEQSSDARPAPSVNTSIHQADQSTATSQDHAIPPSSQSNTAVAKPEIENGNTPSNSDPTAAAETSANKAPWTSSSWGFDNAASGSSSEGAASRNHATQAKPATVEDVPDAEAGPSNSSGA